MIVLFVEDEDTVRRFAKRALTRAGYTVLAAANGSEAIAALEAHRGSVDLLLTDVVMPGMSGPELAKRLVAMMPEMRVIYTSGYTLETMVREGRLAEDVNYLPKPYTLNELTGKVAAVLGPRP